MNNIYFPVHNKIGTMLDVLSFHFSVLQSFEGITKLLLQIENDSKRKMFFM